MPPITSDEKAMAVFTEALTALNRSGVRYVIGGAFAVHHYTGAWRNTNDIDVYLTPEQVPVAVEALTIEGFRDYGEMAAGDREWIYHAVKDGILIDAIWGPPNGLEHIDGSIYERGKEGIFLGLPVRFMPVDELMRSKLFTLNHDRTDWPDLFKLVRSCPEEMDWGRLLEKLGEHWQVLLSFIILFDWVYPAERKCVPQEIREKLLRRKMELPQESDGFTREAILDPWIYTRPE